MSVTRCACHQKIMHEFWCGCGCHREEDKQEEKEEKVLVEGTRP